MKGFWQVSTFPVWWWCASWRNWPFGHVSEYYYKMSRIVLQNYKLHKYHIAEQRHSMHCAPRQKLFHMVSVSFDAKATLRLVKIRTEFIHVNTLQELLGRYVLVICFLKITCTSKVFKRRSSDLQTPDHRATNIVWFKSSKTLHCILLSK